MRGKAIEISHGADTDFFVSEVGLYIFVHTNIGVTLSWDRGTWAEVRLEPYHSSRVSNNEYHEKSNSISFSFL